MSLANFGSQMLAEIRRIAEQTVRRDGTHLRWATVTSSDPLRIRYDGETSESIVPPQNLAAGLDVGDRVRVGKQDGQATIIGPTDGHRGIGNRDHFLRIGEDGAPRLWADPELVHGREYTNAGPGADRNRVAVVTQFGTFGTLAGMLDRAYLGFASGRVTVPISNNYGTVTVTFPAGMFSSTPRVMVTPVSAAGAGTDIEVRTSGASATGFTLRMARSTNADTDAEWFAVAP